MKDATDVISAKDRPNLSSFDWQDPFNFSDQLTEEERMLQESVRGFAQNELQPRILNAYRNATIEPEIFREMGGWAQAMWLMGLWPARWSALTVATVR
jgi:glutaryl-CoA dehydrogenase